MDCTVKEVLSFVEENDVKFIRLAFCDLFGVQKNISIMPEELPRAFENGISFDASSIDGFLDVTNSDLYLIPDAGTIAVLPWRPGPGRVVRFYCDIRYPDGRLFWGDSRSILKKAAQRCIDKGYVCKIGAECEFFLFKTDEEGNPTTVTIDKGGYMDISPLDKGENIRRETCLCLAEMDLKPENSHHEQGPGQNEIDIKFSDALSCADNYQTFKSVVKAIAGRNGLFASFMPKPLKDTSGNGLHINMSLSQNGHNIFTNDEKNHSAAAESFIAGILERAKEISLFLNSTANSYQRLGERSAPGYVSWSHQNRSQLIRIPAATGEQTRLELRSPDPALNPYLAFALILHAGLDGIEKALKLPEPQNLDLGSAAETETARLEKLPQDLKEAVALAKASKFISTYFNSELIDKFLAVKSSEADLFAAAENKETFCQEHYFEVL